MDPAPARSMAGVREVVELPDAVAVVADGYWYAQQAVNALEPRFTDGGVGDVDTAAIRARYSAALDDDRMDEDPEVPEGGRTVTAAYGVPYLSHATMEPMCATVRIVDGRCDVWCGTQDPLSTRAVDARVADMDRDDVDVYNQQLGGGFGRRLPGTYDYVEQAVEIARVTSPRSVKLVWSRDQDMRHGYYRPLVLARFQGVLDEAGCPVSWATRFIGGMSDRIAATPPYAVEDTDIGAVSADGHLREGDYDMVRLADAPRVHVSFVESGGPWGGIGEPGVPPVAPAVANAVFALTGTRLRELPLELA